MLSPSQLPFLAANSLSRAYLKSSLWKLSNRTLALPETLIRYSSRTMASGPARTGPFISQSGRNYNIKRVLQEETDPPHQVYIAT